MKHKSVLQRMCSLSVGSFLREVIESGGSLRLEKRESAFLLCCHSYQALRPWAGPGTNGASSGLLFPSNGHSWGNSASQYRVAPPPSPFPHPSGTSSTLVLPPSPAVPLMCLPSTDRAPNTEGMCAWETHTLISTVFCRSPSHWEKSMLK